MANTFLGGTLQFQIDGVPYRLGGNFKIKLGGQVRTPKMGLSGVLGYVTSYSEAEIDCELVMDGSVTMAALKAINNSTLIATLDNGRTYMLNNAWQSGDDPQIDTKEAMASLKFASVQATEM